MPFAVGYMVVKPPGYGLYLGIPGIGGFIGMAIVAGTLECYCQIGGYFVSFCDVVGVVAG